MARPNWLKSRAPVVVPAQELPYRFNWTIALSSAVHDLWEGNEYRSNIYIYSLQLTGRCRLSSSAALQHLSHR